MTYAASDSGLSDSAPLAALRARLESQAEQLRRREQSLHEAEAEFSALLENNVAAIATLRDGVFLRANSLMQALLGVDEAALVGRHIGSVCVEADAGAVEMLDAIAACEARARTTRLQLLRGGVEPVSCLLHHGPYPTRGVAYTSLVVAVHASGEQATRIAFEDSQERFGRFAGALDEALLVFDARSGTALFANDRIVDVLGTAVEDFYRDPGAAWRRVAPDDLAALESRFAAALESGPQETDLRVVHPGPSIGVVRLRIIPARAGSSELYCLAEDVTEARSLAQSRLDEAIAQRDLLVREVHHRIKNNLQGVAGLLQQSAARRPEIAQQLVDIAAQIQAIAQVHGLQVRDQTDLAFCALVRAIVANLVRGFGRPIRLDDEAFAALEGWRVPEQEAVPLALVVNEMCTNAIKHCAPPEGVIAVRMACEDDALVLEVVNAGRLPEGFSIERLSGAPSGLGLARALLPRRGARLAVDERLEQVVARLVVAPPTLRRPAQA